MISTAPGPTIENIPQELREVHRWVVWSDKSGTKLPHRCDGGGMASSTDPSTWATFSEAVDAFASGDYSGIGFVLGDGFAGVDFDDCINDSGYLDWGSDIIANFDTYAEISPSGSGVKMFLMGTKPDGVGCKKREMGPDKAGQIEIYDTDRFFTVTGQLLPEKPAIVRDCQSPLNDLCRQLWPPKPATNGFHRRTDRSEDPSRAMKRAAAYLDKLPASISGEGGHDRLFQAACECLRFGLPDSDAMVLLRDYNRRAMPEWTEKELLHKLSGAHDEINGSGFGSRLIETNKVPDNGRALPADPSPRHQPRDNFFNSDIGNADRFVDQHGQHIRFCHQTGDWLHWCGNRWRWDDSGRALSLAKKTALSILTEAQEAARAAASATDEATQAKHSARAAALAKWAIASQKRDRIAAMLTLAQPDLSISTDQLDADPVLLNCLNGTLNTRTGKLQPHRQEDFITRICRGNFRSDVGAPNLERCLARLFRAHPDLIDFVQRAVGYGATGFTSEQCLFFLYGRGANGKTTIIDAVMYALGDYAAKADPDLLMARDGSAAHPCNVADLLGRRMVVCSETNEGKRFDESKLKDLVGETRLKARKMRENFFEFLATHKIFQYSNHKPTVKGTDHGFWRRMKVVPFIETIADDEKDSALPAKLRCEVDGVLRWIVAGAVAWHRDGLGVPQEVVDATSDYRAEMDSIGAFIAEQCVPGDRTSSYAIDLYAAYSRWFDAAGERAMSQRRLGTTLAERGHISERCSYSGRTKWLGIGLRTTES